MREVVRNHCVLVNCPAKIQLLVNTVIIGMAIPRSANTMS
jgi:hypothetical protein